MHEWFHLGAWFAISCLMHDLTTHGTLFNPFEHLQFRATSCTLRGALFHIVACILMHEWFHLGAWFAISCLMHDLTTHGTLFNPFEHLQFRATSCTLRGALFHIVACILMHDRITYGTLFNPFGYSRFRATSCTLRGSVISYRSVHLDFPSARNEVRWFLCVFFRATSCTLRWFAGYPCDRFFICRLGFWGK